jgi:hypothetical protein
MSELQFVQIANGLEKSSGNAKNAAALLKQKPALKMKPVL